jgi:hypothetical protein
MMMYRFASKGAGLRFGVLLPQVFGFSMKKVIGTLDENRPLRRLFGVNIESVP